MTTGFDDEYVPSDSPDTEEYQGEWAELPPEVDPVDRAEQEEEVLLAEDFLDEDGA